MKHLVLLGGGPTHLQLLRELSQATLADVEITLVAPSARRVHLPLLPAWVAGQCSIEEISVPYAPLTAMAGVRLIESEVVQLDAASREVALSNGEVLAYDVLSIDADAVANREAIPGARDNALFLRPVEQFIRLWGALITLSQAQTLNLVVVGDEAPAIELSVAIRRRLARRVRVALVTGSGAPMPSQKPGFQEKVRQALKRQHVTLFEDRCDAVSSRQMQLGMGMRLGCDAPVLAQEPGPPLWLFDSGLGLDVQGLLITGPTLQSESHPEVFGVGELSMRLDRPLRQATWYPLQPRRSVLMLSRNLIRFLAGEQLLHDDVNEPGFDVLGMGRHAMARIGQSAIGGHWVGWLKYRADRAWRNRVGDPSKIAAMSKTAAEQPGELDTVRNEEVPPIS